ncbi:hypothetical protein CCMA1212_001718 [Trichoderma ghanense]|uniref:Uncharacterized protein n=1 Tax=Trichoderma ghanense TaxID=65468 RepID=A0ABY2HDE7_9HYPO
MCLYLDDDIQCHRGCTAVSLASHLWAHTKMRNFHLVAHPRSLSRPHSSLAVLAFPRRSWIGLSERPHRSEAPSAKPKLGAVAFINPFRLFGALICHADSLSSPDLLPTVTNLAIGSNKLMSKALSSVIDRPSCVVVAAKRKASTIIRRHTARRWTTEDATEPSVTAYKVDFGPVGVRTVQFPAEA